MEKPCEASRCAFAEIGTQTIAILMHWSQITRNCAEMLHLNKAGKHLSIHASSATDNGACRGTEHAGSSTGVTIRPQADGVIISEG